MAKAEIEIEILADGTIKTTTGKIDFANHHSAEGFVEFLAKKVGGSVEKKKRGEVHSFVSQAHKVKQGG